MGEPVNDPLLQLQRQLGVASDGVSFQTKRALMENGVLPAAPMSPQPVAPVAPARAPAVGANYTPAQLERLRAAEQARQAESLRLLLEQRQAVPAPTPDRPLRGGMYRD